MVLELCDNKERDTGLKMSDFLSVPQTFGIGKIKRMNPLTLADHAIVSAVVQSNKH
jgi:hypothetical protein